MDPVAEPFSNLPPTESVIHHRWPGKNRSTCAMSSALPLRRLFSYQFALGVGVGLGETTACKYCQNAAAVSNWTREKRFIISISEEKNQQLHFTHCTCSFFNDWVEFFIPLHLSVTYILRSSG